MLAINIGTAANDGTGDTLRDAFQKINTNFASVASGSSAMFWLTGLTSIAGVSNSLKAVDIAGYSEGQVVQFSFDDILYQYVCVDLGLLPTEVDPYFIIPSVASGTKYWQALPARFFANSDVVLDASIYDIYANKFIGDGSGLTNLPAGVMNGTCVELNHAHQLFATGVTAKLDWHATALWDDASWFNAANDRIIVTETGRFAVSFQFNADEANWNYIVYKNGVADVTIFGNVLAIRSANYTEMALTSGDYLEIYAQQSSGTSKYTYYIATGGTQFRVRRIH
jgi:hypothetical protein